MTLWREKFIRRLAIRGRAERTWYFCTVCAADLARCFGTAHSDFRFAGSRAISHDGTMQSGTKEILPLTSLRFFAASLVVLEHLQMIPGLEWASFKSNFPGIAGVRIFFVLSGFILSYTYWNRDWTRDFRANTRDFYWSRFARIFPLHWLMFLLALPLGLNSNIARVDVANFPWLLTLTDRLWPGFPIVFQPVKVAWTLSCEMLFYLSTPLLFMFLTRRKNPLFASSLVLAVFTPIIVAVALMFPKLNWSAYLEMPQFLLGIVGYHLSQRMSLSRWANALLAGGVLLVVAAAMTADALLRPEFICFAYAPGAWLIILGCASVSGRLDAFLSRPFLVLLGHASYALYLVHDPVLRYCKVALNRGGIVLPFPLSLLAATLLFSAIVGASILCFKLYENPARLKLRSLLKRKSNSPQPPGGVVKEISLVES